MTYIRPKRGLCPRGREVSRVGLPPNGTKNSTTKNSVLSNSYLTGGGGIENGTYGTGKNLCINPLLLLIATFGPIYYISIITPAVLGKILEHEILQSRALAAGANPVKSRTSKSESCVRERGERGGGGGCRRPCALAFKP